MMGYRNGDMKAALSRDPAACSSWEVALCYPGYRAVRMYRRAHWFHVRGMRLIARLISENCRFRTGVDIHPAAVIGERFFIDHGQGVVIGETAVIGDDVTLYQGATLGGTGKEKGKRHPTIGSHVTISAGASVLGPLIVGDYAKIGAGAVVLCDVPAHATVVGVPGHVVRQYGCRVPCEQAGLCDDACEGASACPRRVRADAGEAGVDLDHAHLPDPVQRQIDEMRRRIELLEQARENG